MKDVLSDVCFELQPCGKFNTFALYRAVFEVGRGERVGILGASAFRPQFPSSSLVLLLHGQFGASHRSLLVCACSSGFLLLPEHHTGWVTGFIAFEREAHCAIGKGIVDAELAGVVDRLDSYCAVQN